MTPTTVLINKTNQQQCGRPSWARSYSVGPSQSCFQPMKRKGCFWMNGFWGVYSWWPAYANTNICIYSGLTRARRLFRHFPFLSQFMLIHLFVPICVNSSVGISLDARRLGLKHGGLMRTALIQFFVSQKRSPVGLNSNTLIECGGKLNINSIICVFAPFVYFSEPFFIGPPRCVHPRVVLYPFAIVYR